MLVVSIVERAVEHSFMGTYILSGIQPQPSISSVGFGKTKGKPMPLVSL